VFAQSGAVAQRVDGDVWLSQARAYARLHHRPVEVCRYKGRTLLYLQGDRPVGEHIALLYTVAADGTVTDSNPRSAP